MDLKFLSLEIVFLHPTDVSLRPLLRSAKGAWAGVAAGGSERGLQRCCVSVPASPARLSSGCGEDAWESAGPRRMRRVYEE